MTADPHVLPDPVDLGARGRGLLSTAQNASSGRAADNLVQGGDKALTQTLLALTEGSVLADHRTPGPATLHVLQGSGVLTVGDERLRLAPGHWSSIPEATHGLEATTDLVCLLTVATPR